jgi:hypothetical protein
MITFGVNLSYGRLYPDADSASLYREMLALAELGDQLGFPIIWLLEHHFTFAMQTPNPLMIAAQFSSRVKCRIGLERSPRALWSGRCAKVTTSCTHRSSIQSGRAPGTHPRRLSLCPPCWRRPDPARSAAGCRRPGRR